MPAPGQEEVPCPELRAHPEDAGAGLPPAGPGGGDPEALGRGCGPFGWGAPKPPLGRLRPVARPAPGGAGFLWKKAGGRTRAPPWTRFYGRSFPLAGFWVGCLWCVRGAISSGMLRPIWDAFSRETMLESIFCERRFPTPLRLCLHAPKPSPWGRWAGEAGSDEGATLYPTFPCRSRKGGSLLSPQRTFFPAPLGKSITPHPSPPVTASPKGSLWVVPNLPEKASQIRARKWAP